MTARDTRGSAAGSAVTTLTPGGPDRRVALYVSAAVLTVLLVLATLAVAPPVAGLDDPDDDQVVVRFADDHVVTGSNVGAGDVPDEPNVTTVSGTGLVVTDGVLETENGDAVEANNNSVRVRSTDPDLVVTTGNVVNDTIVVDDKNVITEEGEVQLEAGGEDIVYPHYDEYYYDINITSVEDGIGEGEILEIDVKIENNHYAGDESEDIEIRLVDDDGDVISDTEKEERISVPAGGTVSETLEYETSSDDNKATAVEVDILGDGDKDVESDIDITEAKLLVEILETNTPATGDDLEVTVEMDRRGDYPQGEQEYLLEFDVDGSYETSESVTLDTGEVDTQTFSIYEITDSDTSSVDVRVSSGDDSDEKAVDVYGDALLENNLEATIVDRNWPDEGENLTLTTFVQYTDDSIELESPKEYPVELYVEGDLVDSQTARLEPGDPFDQFDLVYETQPGDAPRVDAEVVSPGEGDSARPRINGSGFEVSIVQIDDPVNESDRLTTIAQIENTGDITDEQNVRLRIDSGYDDPQRTSREVVDNATVELGPGHRTTERFTYRTSADDVPIIEVAIISDDDEALGNATVRSADPWFGVSDTSTQHDEAADEVTLSATINNTGLETDEQYVEFIVDGEVVYIDRVSLGAWEERVLTTTIDAPDPGSYDFSVVTDDTEEVAAGAVTVDDPSAEPTDDGVDDGVDDDTDPPADEEDGLPWYLVALGVLGVLASVLVLVVYRNDPENFPPDATTLQQQARSAVQATTARATMLVAAVKSGDPGTIAAALKRMLGLGAGSLIVQNELPRETLVRVQCRTGEDTVVLEDLELGPNERRELGSLPDAGEFTVGAGVEDITSHQEVFSGVSGDVGVVLKSEGILIANLG